MNDWLLRGSLVIVWLATGAASLYEIDGQSRDVLADAGVVAPDWLVMLLIVGGAWFDLAVGLALWRRPGRIAYLAALVLMAGMTIVATVMQPNLWLHPFGPLLKNLPIAAILLHLLQQSKVEQP